MTRSSLLLPCLLAWSLAWAAAGAAPPNFILFYVDDLGWNQTSLQMMTGRGDSKHPLHRTPNLERLAARGMRFSSAYAPSPVCTPSRASIQLGKTPARLHQTTVHDVMARKHQVDLRDELSLADVINAAHPAYRTAAFGKGISFLRMKDLGYELTDEFDRAPNGNFHGDWVSNDNKVPLPADDPKRMFSLTRTATKFLRRQVRENRPFFMMVSHYALHVDNDSLASTRRRWLDLLARKHGIAGGLADERGALTGKAALYWEEANYAAMVEDLDRTLGTLLDELRTLGIEKNTYFIYTSDNGGGTSLTPLAGGKAKMWEGGIRVPMVVAGPGIPANSQCDTPVAQWDYLPTLHALSGSKAPLPPDLDGRNLQPLFERGNKGRIAPRHPGLVFHFPWYAGQPLSAIRHGEFKLMRQLNTREVKLFNVVEDLGETNDLAKSMPEKTRELEKLLDDYLDAIDAWKMPEVYAQRIAELEGWIHDSRERIASFGKELHTENLKPERRRFLEEEIPRQRKRIATLEATLREAREHVGCTTWK